MASYAQDVSATPIGTYHADSLKTTRDTVDVAFRADLGIGYHTITCYTSTGTDTVKIYTKSLDAGYWVQHGVVDASDNSDATQIIISTTPKEFIIYDVQPGSIRITSPGTTAAVFYFTVGVKGVR